LSGGCLPTGSFGGLFGGFILVCGTDGIFEGVVGFDGETGGLLT